MRVVAIDALFHWVLLKQDILSSRVRAGDSHSETLRERAVVVDNLPLTPKQPEPGYILEVFSQV